MAVLMMIMMMMAVNVFDDDYDGAVDSDDNVRTCTDNKT